MLGRVLTMTENTRIALNIFATYGRNLYRLVIGLLCGRWSLMALGAVDYGLNGLVGGMTAFITFINMSFDASIARFYSFAIGEAIGSADKEQGLENCRKWFSIALLLHTAMPLTVMTIGYPIGVWAIRHFLRIPPDRISDCIWVFRFVCCSCLVTMMCSPFTAMYRAKQYIAELTIYTFVTLTLNAAFLYYMASHPGVWLKGYAFWTCILSITPQAIIAIRAIKLFPECRLRVSAWREKARIKELFAYIGWSIFGDFIYILKGQGIAILVNKYFGPAVNASMAVANTVNGHTLSFSGAMRGAFQPAIVTAYGAGQMEHMRALSYRTCKFGVVLSLLFMLPLFVELKEVMRLWLVTPPEFVVEFCMVMMVTALIDYSTTGCGIAVLASGRIAKYSLFSGVINALTLPVAWLFVILWNHPLCVNAGLFIIMVLVVMVRVFMARAIVGISVRYWGIRIALPLMLISAVSLLAGYMVRFVMSASLGRVVVTTLVCEVVFLPLTWFFVLDVNERLIVIDKCRKLLKRN